MADLSAHAIAILADVHFHDPHGDFGGAGITIGARRLALRSWEDTRRGARAFNETAAALAFALDRVVAAGVRLVVLAGDYSDDGQAENTARLADLLRGYERRHGLQFFAIPGNHDVYGPLGKHVSTRFVASPGRTVLVTSDPEERASTSPEAEPDAVLTASMRCGGLPLGLMPMERYGLFRQPGYLHWESPFGESDRPAARIYAATAADGATRHQIMDASYLVEPEPGLWLLMLDANVFEPRPGRHDPARKRTFIGPSDAGWTAVLRVKPFLLDWIADVTARAKRLGKVLVAVSHYPVLDPFRDASRSEAALFGETSVVRRTPTRQVGEALIAAGLRWHFGGHMHVHAATTLRGTAGTLTDVSLPSLVAWPAAFRIVRLSKGTLSISTVRIDDMPADPDIVAVYRAGGCDDATLPFGAFLARQCRTHAVERRLKQDWPEGMQAFVAGKSLADLAAIAGDGAAALARRRGLARADLDACPLVDLVADAHLLKMAGSLAAGWIAPGRLALYKALAADFGDAEADPAHGPAGFLRRYLSMVQVSLHRMADADAPFIPAAEDASPVT